MVTPVRALFRGGTGRQNWLPSSQYGRGDRSGGIFLCWFNSRDPALDQGFGTPARSIALCAGPLTPDPSPSLGRGEPKSIRFFEAYVSL